MKTDITVGEIVANDYRAATIFKEAGIDFCCGGKKPLDDYCREKGIDKEGLTEKLENLENTPNSTTLNFKEWEPGFLCDYIVNTHHKYVLKSLPDLVYYTGKLVSVHGEQHPELKEVAGLFAEINRELLQHLKNEEEVFFPSIKELFNTGSEKAKATVKSEIARLSGEHEFAGGNG